MAELPVQPTDSDSSDLIRSRYEKIRAIRVAGIEPYPYSFAYTHTVEQLHLADFDSLAREGAAVRVPGRVLANRQHGRLQFLDVGAVCNGAKTELR